MNSQDRSRSTSLGLAMLVKGDATDGLRRCLSSCRHLFDAAAACVDLRHGDSAVAILEEFGVQVDRTPFEMWTDQCPHFGNMRNRSFDLLDTDYICYVDADEEMACGDDLRHHVALAGANNLDAVAVQMEIYTGDQLGDTTPQMRVIRRGGRMKHPIHNMPVSVKSRIDCISATIRTSYDGDVDERTRSKRALPALRKLWDAGPTRDERAHAAYFLARLWFARREWANGIEWAEALLMVEPAHKGYADIWPPLIHAEMILNGWGAAWQRWNEAITKHPRMCDLWHMGIGLTVAAWEMTANEDEVQTVGWGKTRIAIPNISKVARLLGLSVEVGDAAE